MCWVPSVTSAVMCWNDDVVQALLNICYPFSQLYVGKKLHVSQWETLGYILFWLTVIPWKLYFGYTFIINPITIGTHADYIFSHIL